MSDLSLFEIRKAVRKGTPALIGLWGGSGSGKTYTALHIARGLVGPTGKIGMIDTENRRSEFYSDLVGGWDHLDLQPPFTPDRYRAAFESYERAGGYGCVIVDSMSHVWEGDGGVLDMADAGRTQDGRPLIGLKKWQAPKMAYKRMVNSLLRAPFHVIFCLRAKDGVKQVGSGQSAKIESVGAQPICGKGFIYEVTVGALLGPDHCPIVPGERSLIQCDPLIPSIKAPDALKSIFTVGQPLGVETGKRIAEWVSGGAAFDVDAARLEREGRNIATMGSEALARFWKGLGGAGQRTLAPIKDELKSIAAEADEQTRYDSQSGYDDDGIAADGRLSEEYAL